MRLARLGACAGALGLVGLLATPVAANSRTGGTGTVNCNDGSVTYTPTTIWPPNHKMVDVSITYNHPSSDAGTGESISLQVVSITDNEIVNGQELKGSGQPNPPQGLDWSFSPAPVNGSAPGSVSETAQVRAERSGTGDGRVYDIKVQCTDKLTGIDPNDTSESGPTGESHMVDLLVTVPHDQGNGGGASAASTSSATITRSGTAASVHAVRAPATTRTVQLGAFSRSGNQPI